MIFRQREQRELVDIFGIPDDVPLPDPRVIRRVMFKFSMLKGENHGLKKMRDEMENVLYRYT